MKRLWLATAGAAILSILAGTSGGPQQLAAQTAKLRVGVVGASDQNVALDSITFLVVIVNRDFVCAGGVARQRDPASFDFRAIKRSGHLGDPTRDGFRPARAGP